MHRASSISQAAERARWLSELLSAIDEAQEVAWRLSRDDELPEAMALYTRLELARSEVEALRHSGWAEPRESFPSEWIDFLPEEMTITSPVPKG